jgi:phage gp46-like protein
MFDIATRPVPASVAQVNPGVPFDWRLAAPLPAAAYPWTDYSTPSGQSAGQVDVLATYAIALEDTLQTAIVHSLFTDARAGDGEGVTLLSRDRRGWVGDDFQAAGDSYGSLLWLVLIGKHTDDLAERARFYAAEALAWMVRDGVASRVVVEATWVDDPLGDRLALRPQIYQSSHVSPVYDVLWGTTIRRGASE